MSGHSTYQPQGRLMKWLEARLPLCGLIHSSFVAYPTPRNLNYWWTFGGILTFMLAVVLLGLGRGVIPWVFGEANWRVVTSNLELLSWGRYPVDQAWRLGLALAVIVVLSVLSWRVSRLPAGARLRRLSLTGWFRRRGNEPF